VFVDKVKIYVKGGDGGNGIVAFRREKYVPFGGPAGGDGGRGGDVILRVDEGLRTLIDFKYRRHFKASRGENGKNKGMHGADADDLVVRVPPGTVVVDAETNEVIADLVRHGQEAVVARGGRGGRGNMRFATPSNPAPSIAENGEPGEERWIILELKLIADVGLIGFPNAGKSTLISVVSAAKPKIANYPFTTLTPNLGVVDVDGERSFVMADLPGLIEGAHRGVGLGLEFLRHVERTRLLLHVVDMAAVEGRDPYEDWLAVNRELRLYDARLAERPQIIVANKMDLPEAAENLVRFCERLKRDGLEGKYEVFPISAATRSGVVELIRRTADLLARVSEPASVGVPSGAAEALKVYRAEFRDDRPAFSVRREGDVFVVEGEEIDKWLRRLPLRHRDAAVRFAGVMRRMGVDAELRRLGATDGSIVRIGGYEFEFVEFEDRDA